MKTKVCPKCGKDKNIRGFTNHLKACKGTLSPEPAPEPTPEPAPASLDPDLQAPIDAVKQTPQERARLVRWAFSARGWPNGEHPGTVRDFLTEHKIPFV